MAESLALVSLVLLGLAVVKPWGGPSGTADGPDARSIAGPGPLARAPVAVPSASASQAGTRGVATPDRSLSPDEIACEGGWQLVSLSRLADWSVREWLPVLPGPASGPLDPSLVAIRLADGAIRALGVCGDQVPGALATVVIRQAWRTSSDGRSLVALRLLPLTDPLSPAGLARLYRPADAGPSGAWPNGRYVLELGVADTTSASWLRIEIGPAGAAR
ncbi:MAG: hypothetical protein ACXWMX_03450 [Candidatus Limnocylindrales bacterium]